MFSITGAPAQTQKFTEVVLKTHMRRLRFKALTDKLSLKGSVMLEYIPNEYGRDWVSLDQNKGVFLPTAFVDINEGNLRDALIFAQIMYWHRPNKKTGKTKLTQIRNNHYWLAKNHSDWYDECRIPTATARKSLNRLKKRSLIVYELHGFSGNKTPWIRVNWDEFERRMRAWEAGIDLKSLQTDQAEHGLCPNETGECAGGTDNLIPQVESNTETTIETTPQTTTEENKTTTQSTADSRSRSPEIRQEELAYEDAKLRSVISEVWDITAPGRIQIIRKTLLGLHTHDSGYYESNVKPPATIEEIRQMEDFYHHHCPDMKLPASPEKIQDWIYQVRNLIPAYLTRKGYKIKLDIKVPKKFVTSESRLQKYVREYYPEEWQRLQYHFEGLEQQASNHNGFLEHLKLGMSFRYYGEKVEIYVPIPENLKTWAEIESYLEANHPDELNRLNREWERIWDKREKEFQEILQQG